MNPTPDDSRATTRLMENKDARESVHSRLQKKTAASSGGI
jgi:hypothetical protein